MKKVTGIGGLFIKCKDPKKMMNWYEKHLGLNMDQYGTCFEWKQAEGNDLKGFTQWSTIKEDSKFFASSKRDFIVNYRVENLSALVEVLKLEKVEILDDISSFDYGKFVHILDCEGNEIELWEPNDIEFEKIVVGRTK
jgi:predicted enzyme related to lactoylglutathione lyase